MEQIILLLAFLRATATATTAIKLGKLLYSTIDRILPPILHNQLWIIEEHNKKYIEEET